MMYNSNAKKKKSTGGRKKRKGAARRVSHKYSPNAKAAAKAKKAAKATKATKASAVKAATAAAKPVAAKAAKSAAKSEAKKVVKEEVAAAVQAEVKKATKGVKVAAKKVAQKEAKKAAKKAAPKAAAAAPAKKKRKSWKGPASARKPYTKSQMSKHGLKKRAPSDELDARLRRIGGRAELPRTVLQRQSLADRFTGGKVPEYWKNGRRHRRHYESNMFYMSNRRSRRHYASNRRRYSARRNPDVMSLVKTGAYVAGGFMAHRGLSALVIGFMPKQTGTTKLLVNTLLDGAVAFAGVYATTKFAPVKEDHKKEIVAGMVTSAVHRLVTNIVAMFSQPAAAALSAYPDAAGRQFHTMAGIGSYEEMPPGYAGFGEYVSSDITQAAAGFGAITQAAAGMGAITQAAAGFGEYTQAAAGVGEYFAQGVQGIGEYEAVDGFGTNELINEGIHPNLMSAERELSVAEAVAGLGAVQDAPLESIVQAQQVAAPVLDAPGGSRAGILAGGDGIFG